MTSTPPIEQLSAVLGRSHERLVKALAGLTEEHLTSRSYDEDWSIARVASHLGSSAEIFGTIVEAGLTNGPAPGVEQFEPVWDRWNVKSPAAQAADAVQVDGAFLDRLEGLPADEAQLAERLTMTAEAFVRLVYGRLDPEHTPESVDASGTDLDDLRRAFPGL
jgi:hypothetical protein